MDDLISRKETIDYLMTNMGWHDEDGYEVDDADDKRTIITDLINGIPTVEAVPVIRCKDCKHWGVVDGCNWMTCRKGILTGWSNKGYGYCSYGERKTNVEGN